MSSINGRLDELEGGTSSVVNPTPRQARRAGKVSEPVKHILPTDSAARKNIPLARGLLDYFPAALAAVAEVSRSGNDKHNPGQELHWSRGKSTDHADTILRHLVDRGTIDSDDGQRHTAKIAWRALALLQEELEAAGSPPGRGSRFPFEDTAAPPSLPTGGHWAPGTTEWVDSLDRPVAARGVR